MTSRYPRLVLRPTHLWRLLFDGVDSFCIVCNPDELFLILELILRRTSACGHPHTPHLTHVRATPQPRFDTSERQDRRASTTSIDIVSQVVYYTFIPHRLLLTVCANLPAKASSSSPERAANKFQQSLYTFPVTAHAVSRVPGTSDR